MRQLDPSPFEPVEPPPLFDVSVTDQNCSVIAYAHNIPWDVVTVLVTNLNLTNGNTWEITKVYR